MKLDNAVIRFLQNDLRIVLGSFLKALETFFENNFVNFCRLLKNGLIIALGRSLKALETFFLNHFFTNVSRALSKKILKKTSWCDFRVIFEKSDHCVVTLHNVNIYSESHCRFPQHRIGP